MWLQVGRQSASVSSIITRTVATLQLGQQLREGLPLSLSDVAEVLQVQKQQEGLQVAQQPGQDWGGYYYYCCWCCHYTKSVITVMVAAGLMVCGGPEGLWSAC